MSYMFYCDIDWLKMTSIMIPLSITFRPDDTKTTLRLTKLYDMDRIQVRDKYKD